MEFTEISAKTVDDAITEACQKFSVTSDKLEYEVIEEGSAGFLGIGFKAAVIKARVKSSVTDTAREFLNDVFEAMNLAVVIDVKYDDLEHFMDIDLSGDEMGILIGKRGQTLDSLQYLTSLVVNKDVDNYIRVKVDTENYRKRRKDTLENLAKNIGLFFRGHKFLLEKWMRSHSSTHPLSFYQYCFTDSLDSFSDKSNISAICFIVSAKDIPKFLHIKTAPLISLSSRIC